MQGAVQETKKGLSGTQRNNIFAASATTQANTNTTVENADRPFPAAFQIITLSTLL